MSIEISMKFTEYHQFMIHFLPMQILTVDIGTGTQDIFLYDSRLDLENGFKLVVPSPTMLIHRLVQQATRRSQPILLYGVTMGGGPSHWAVEAHLKAGLPVYATPQAARSFDDDLARIQEMGIHLVSEDEAACLPEEVLRLRLCDFDFHAICRALEPFGVSLDALSAVAVGVFDHGNAPPHVSDRQFRFEYLDRRIRAENRLSAFAYPSDRVPGEMTRLQAVVDSARGIDAPLVVMDTAPAAVLGATFDPRIASRQRKLIANVGNFHTLAFRLGPAGIEGVFEHHTGLIEATKLDDLLRRLADGSLCHADVFNDHGHGALIYSNQPLDLGQGDWDVAVTGPRRNLLAISPQAGRLIPYMAVPFGDMMIAGCFGLLAATADVLPALAEPIRESLSGRSSGTAPWDVALSDE
jgi:uncharacterized protein (DUF1786 family)